MVYTKLIDIMWLNTAVFWQYWQGVEGLGGGAGGCYYYKLLEKATRSRGILPSVVTLSWLHIHTYDKGLVYLKWMDSVGMVKITTAIKVA